MTETYLYGAAVQGIQSFIFQTDKLRRIASASEIVEQICTTAFDEFGNKEESIVRAAGNIKHLFNDKISCERAVKEFPRKIMEMAPGITISQAVVKLEGEYSSFEMAIDELERRLHIQRNKPVRPLFPGLTGIYHAPDSGLPLDEFYLEQTANKAGESDELCLKCFGKSLMKEQYAYNIEDITENNDWVAVIHVDGNGLGQIVQAIGKDSRSFKYFSEELEKVTEKAAQAAYNAVKDKFQKSRKIPIRPIILGGDDLTLVCRADIALDYTKAFFASFEESSYKQLNEILKKGKLQFENLTACAGIAFVKSSYPFHYAVKLAESLCLRAKEDAKKEHRLVKGLAPSCLMFHKVQDSFVEVYELIKERELTAADGASFEFGPYYLKNTAHRWSIDELTIETAKFSETQNGNVVKSHLRQWVSIRLNNKGAADQKVARLTTMLGEQSKKFKLDELTSEKDNRFPVYDMLALHSVLNQKTK